MAHILLSIAFYGLPFDWEWWVLVIGSGVAMTECTAYICSLLESEDIVMLYHAPASKSTLMSPKNAAVSARHESHDDCDEVHVPLVGNSNSQ